MQTAYVQQITADCGCTAGSCDATKCDGQTGGTEFDLLETSFVGFTASSETPIAYNGNCVSSGGTECTLSGEPGCAYPGSPCETVINTQNITGCETLQTCEATATKDLSHSYPSCTWSLTQKSMRFQVETEQLDFSAQDFTVISANAYFKGQHDSKDTLLNDRSGTRRPTGTDASAVPPSERFWAPTLSNAESANCQAAYAVQVQKGASTGDDGKYSGRWIRLDIDLTGHTAKYDYTFYEKGAVDDASVQVAGTSSVQLDWYDSAATLFDEGDGSFHWVFSNWDSSHKVFGVNSPNGNNYYRDTGSMPASGKQHYYVVPQ